MFLRLTCVNIAAYIVFLQLLELLQLIMDSYLDACAWSIASPVNSVSMATVM